jgi:hypothetical protein
MNDELKDLCLVTITRRMGLAYALPEITSEITDVVNYVNPVASRADRGPLRPLRDAVLRSFMSPMPK